jgi:hypothetical protein
LELTDGQKASVMRIKNELTGRRPRSRIPVKVRAAILDLAKDGIPIELIAIQTGIKAQVINGWRRKVALKPSAGRVPLGETVKVFPVIPQASENSILKISVGGFDISISQAGV